MDIPVPKDMKEEEKLVIANLSPPKHRNTTTAKQYYNLPHMDPFWKGTEKMIKGMSEGKMTIEENLGTIEFILRQKTNAKKVDLSLLKNFFDNLDSNSKKLWREEIFPFLANLVLKTPQLFPNPIPYLIQGTAESVTFSKEQCACILANMFLGTITKPKNEKLSTYFNFSYWFRKDYKNGPSTLEKLRCLSSYFERIIEGIPDRFIKFERLVLDEPNHGACELSNWRSLTILLKNAVIDPFGKIEDSKNAIEIDFANQFLGGLALTTALAQEEIIFTVSPECFVGCLISEFMTDREAILIQGAETYCNYGGYRKDFHFAGVHQHNIQPNQEKILNREIVAMDALNFKSTNIPELSASGIQRELNKAYIGFRAGDDLGSIQKKHIATGRWGCGVFRANVQLKFIIQWAAASRTGRDMVFYSFEDKKMNNGEKVITKYKNKSVGDLINSVLKAVELLSKNPTSKKDLFSLLLE